jgi:hypothetical protein
MFSAGLILSRVFTTHFRKVCSKFILPSAVDIPSRLFPLSFAIMCEPGSSGSAVSEYGLDGRDLIPDIEPEEEGIDRKQNLK